MTNITKAAEEFVEKTVNMTPEQKAICVLGFYAGVEWTREQVVKIYDSNR